MTRAGQDPPVGETSGAVDHDYDEAELSTREQLLADHPDTAGIVPGGLAFDLVTRQLLFVRQQVADDLVEYYEREQFDLLNYKMHPYIGVTLDDAVYECVFVSDVSAEDLHGWSDTKTYDYPAGRLAAVPVHEAWEAADE